MKNGLIDVRFLFAPSRLALSEAMSALNVCWLARSGASAAPSSHSPQELRAKKDVTRDAVHNEDVHRPVDDERPGIHAEHPVSVSRNIPALRRAECSPGGEQDEDCKQVNGAQSEYRAIRPSLVYEERDD